jgi:hypothetical protein
MAINGLTFVKGEGGLGRPLAGEDYISGMLFYTGSLPSGFSSTTRIKKIFSSADAESAGIKKDYSDATAAVFKYIISNAGAAGDTFKISVTEIPTYVNGVLTANVVSLGTYTVTSADTTIALLGASIAAAINAGTVTHGYSATFNTATLLVTAPKKLGIYLNTGTPVAVTIVGTVAGALTQPTGSGSTVLGVASKQAVWRYHIDEFFRLQPKGVLYVGFYAVPGTYTFSEITTMQNFADGKMRQIGIFLNSEAHAFTIGDLTAIDTEIKTNNDGNYKPLSAIYGADVSATADLTTLTDLNTLTANKVTPVLGQDGAALGYYLYKNTGKSVTILGATLGAVAFAAVSDSIEWVGKFNASNGTELDTPAFANGDLVKDKAQSYLTQLDTNRYVFLLKYVGSAGTYFNDSHTAIIATSDYAYIENNRTIDKAIRGIYSSLLPALGSPIVLNADGTLTDTSVAYFTSLAELNLIQMQRDTELSDFLVTINTAQNVLSTGKLVIAVELLPIGVARRIQVNIGFVVALSA